MPAQHPGGTFQPLQHRSGTLRDRLHSYTKRTLGAGGSVNEAVRPVLYCTLRQYYGCLCCLFSLSLSHTLSHTLHIVGQTPSR